MWGGAQGAGRRAARRRGAQGEAAAHARRRVVEAAEQRVQLILHQLRRQLAERQHGAHPHRRVAVDEHRGHTLGAVGRGVVRLCHRRAVPWRKGHRPARARPAAADAHAAIGQLMQHRRGGRLYDRWCRSSPRRYRATLADETKGVQVLRRERGRRGRGGAACARGGAQHVPQALPVQRVPHGGALVRPERDAQDRRRRERVAATERGQPGGGHERGHGTVRVQLLGGRRLAVGAGAAPAAVAVPQ